MPRPPPPRPLSVLVVDDCRDGADSLALLVRLLGHTPRVAYGGDAALALLRDGAPDVAFLDLRMPGIDGCQLAGHLRRASPRPLLVAVSGLGTVADVARAAGFDHHFLKPMDPAAVTDLLRQHAATRAAAREAPPPTRTSRRTRLTRSARCRRPRRTCSTS